MDGRRAKPHVREAQPQFPPVILRAAIDHLRCGCRRRHRRAKFCSSKLRCGILRPAQPVQRRALRPRFLFAPSVPSLISCIWDTHSLEFPSAMDSTTGETPGQFIKTIWTLTLAVPKMGLAAGKAGQVAPADIGIPKETFQHIGLTYIPRFGHCFRVLLSARVSTAILR